MNTVLAIYITNLFLLIISKLKNYTHSFFLSLVSVILVFSLLFFGHYSLDSLPQNINKFFSFDGHIKNVLYFASIFFSFFIFNSIFLKASRRYMFSFFLIFQLLMLLACSTNFIVFIILELAILSSSHLLFSKTHTNGEFSFSFFSIFRLDYFILLIFYYLATNTFSMTNFTIVDSGLYTFFVIGFLGLYIFNFLLSPLPMLGTFDKAFHSYFLFFINPLRALCFLFFLRLQLNKLHEELLLRLLDPLFFIYLALPAVFLLFRHKNEFVINTVHKLSLIPFLMIIPYFTISDSSDLFIIQYVFFSFYGFQFITWSLDNLSLQNKKILRFYFIFLLFCLFQLPYLSVSFFKLTYFEFLSEKGYISYVIPLEIIFCFLGVRALRDFLSFQSNNQNLRPSLLDQINFVFYAIIIIFGKYLL